MAILKSGLEPLEVASRSWAAEFEAEEMRHQHPIRHSRRRTCPSGKGRSKVYAADGYTGGNVKPFREVYGRSPIQSYLGVSERGRMQNSQADLQIVDLADNISVSLDPESDLYLSLKRIERLRAYEAQHRGSDPVNSGFSGMDELLGFIEDGMISIEHMLWGDGNFVPVHDTTHNEIKRRCHGLDSGGGLARVNISKNFDPFADPIIRSVEPYRGTYSEIEGHNLFTGPVRHIKS